MTGTSKIISSANRECLLALRNFDPLLPPICSSKSATVWVCVLMLEMSRNVFFNPVSPIPSHSQWFIPIPIHTPRFNLVLFPFPLVIPIPSRSHSRTAKYLDQITNDIIGKPNNAQSSTVIKEKNNQIFKKYARSVNSSKVSWTAKMKPNLIVYNKLLQNKCTLTLNSAWWSATCGGKMGNCGILFPPIPIPNNPLPFHSHETSLAIFIPVGIPRNPWEFPT